MRNGQWVVAVPTVMGRIKARPGFLVRDWRIAQAAIEKPVKITLPGPLTIIDSTYDSYYEDERALSAGLIGVETVKKAYAEPLE